MSDLMDICKKNAVYQEINRWKTGKEETCIFRTCKLHKSFISVKNFIYIYRYTYNRFAGNTETFYMNAVTFNKRADNFETTITIAGQRCDLFICDIAENDTNKATEIADKVNNWLSGHIDDVKTFAAEKLLDIKNSSWLEEDETPLTAAGFATQISLDAVTSFADGSLEIHFFDNDIFWGHSIQVSVNEGFVLADADIAG